MAQEGRAASSLLPWASVASMALLILLGGLNSIAGKIRAQEHQEYDGLVAAVLNTISYVVVYFSVLLVEYRRGEVSTEELLFIYGKGGVAYSVMLCAGFCDVASQVLGFTAQPYVAIVVSLLLSQTSTVWNMVWSMLVLQYRYILLECVGLAVCLSGAVLTLLPVFLGVSNGTTASTRTRPFMALFVLLSSAVAALGFVLKEKCFRQWEAEAGRPTEQTAIAASSGGGTTPAPRLNIWCVNSAGAVWSLIFVLPISVVTSCLKKPANMSVSSFMANGAMCFFNSASVDVDRSYFEGACQRGWQSWAIYIVVNISWNYSIYYVLKHQSALMAFMCMKAIAPVALVLSLFNWPIIGAGTVTTTQLASLGIILCGIVMFRHGALMREARFGSQREAAERADYTEIAKQRTARVCLWPLR